DVAYDDAAAHRADVNGRARGDAYGEVDVAHVLAVVAPRVYEDAVAAHLRRHLRRRGFHRGRHADGLPVPRDDLDCAGAVDELEPDVRRGGVLAREATLRARVPAGEEEGGGECKRETRARAARDFEARTRFGRGGGVTFCRPHQ